jgi:hypothetical protein
MLTYVLSFLIVLALVGGTAHCGHGFHHRVDTAVESSR